MKRNFFDLGLVRAARWRFREALGVQPEDAAEILFRLRRLSEREGLERPGVFTFPWGAFEYVALGQVTIQFEEIFLKRHYAFSTSLESPVILDCGGNVGMSAVWFKTNYPSCKLTVFEPDRKLAALIEKNLGHAGISGVECIQKAVWTEDGTVQFDFRGDDRGKISKGSGETVASLDFAECIPASVDLLKMDIEGAEFAVIDHLCDTGAMRRIKNFVCELHILRGMEVRVMSTLQKLIDSGMQLSLNYGAAGPWLGLASEASPFEVIQRNQVLIELYAWRTANAQP